MKHKYCIYNGDCECEHEGGCETCYWSNDDNAGKSLQQKLRQVRKLKTGQCAESEVEG